MWGLGEARELSAPAGSASSERLRWHESGWQQARGVLDDDGTCAIRIQGAGQSLPQLRVEPTQLAWAVSQPGIRVLLRSEWSPQEPLALRHSTPVHRVRCARTCHRSFLIARSWASSMQAQVHESGREQLGGFASRFAIGHP